MNNPASLEACYQKYIHDLTKWLPDGIIETNLELLQKLNLLKFHHYSSEDSSLTRYFHVIESEGKLTLVNEEFVIWIVPESINEIPVTYTLIALNREAEPHLEIGFITRGIYNNSQLVLKIIEKFLIEIQSTQDFLAKLNL